ncbi:MAG TPA: glycosyltransferase [Candidatus Eisenbacteria bacterium]|nr:glycosyltransferase [Candidatus Eisenbacteria bacterium]
MHHSPTNSEGVSAIVPARNEEAVIAACVRSLVVQTEIGEILVVDDQSSDATGEIVRGLAAESPKVRLMEAGELPPGWVGKNHAVWIGAQAARGEWLLFTDADAAHEKDSAARALEIAREQNAALVSFSPEQVMERWYEKALIPCVYLRLGSRFRFAEINDPASPAAAANGQFILIRRAAYEAAGGHASIASDVLEDVALAKRVKGAGQRIWFGRGKGIVRVRMYRSFATMWEGWKKNLYPLMGGRVGRVINEMILALTDVALVLIAGVAIILGLGSGNVLAWSLPAALLLSLGFLWSRELRDNGFSSRLLAYDLPGRLLFAAVLWASYRNHRKGHLEWKGRAYPADTPGASKG